MYLYLYIYIYIYYVYICISIMRMTYLKKSRQATQPFSWPDNDCKHWAKGVLLAPRPSGEHRWPPVMCGNRWGNPWGIHGKSMGNHRRKFRSQTSDNMDRWKAQQGRGREKRKSQKKEDADARKGRKVAKHCVFPMICGSGGSKSRLAKAAGAEPAGQMRDEKLHAVVARSTFQSQNVQTTPGSDHFCKLRCRKSARRCGAKHVSKSKCTKHNMFTPLLEVQMSKKCTAL